MAAALDLAFCFVQTVPLELPVSGEGEKAGVLCEAN